MQKFKGNIPEPLVVFSENSSGRFPMEVGKTYLLFLYEENGRLLVDSCGTSGLVESLRSNVEDVRSLAEHSDIATKHEKRSGSPFRSTVRPLGWELPKRGAPKSRRLLDPDRGLMRLGSHIYVTELGSSEPMLLPWYYIENERLMLYSFEFRIPDLLLYDYDKKPFRYVAQAVGSHVGASAIATWTDRDGDGVFEEFRWASSPIEDLPNWVSVEGDIESSVIH